jgi:hypothetical protein
MQHSKSEADEHATTPRFIALDSNQPNAKPEFPAQSSPTQTQIWPPKNLNSDLIQKPISELVILHCVFASEFRNGHLNSDEFRNWPVSQWPATPLIG